MAFSPVYIPAPVSRNPRQRINRRLHRGDVVNSRYQSRIQKRGEIVLHIVWNWSSPPPSFLPSFFVRGNFPPLFRPIFFLLSTFFFFPPSSSSSSLFEVVRFIFGRGHAHPFPRKTWFSGKEERVAARWRMVEGIWETRTGRPARFN